MSSQIDAVHRGFDHGIEDRLAGFLTESPYFPDPIHGQVQDAEHGLHIGQVAHLRAAGMEQVAKRALVGG